MQFSTCLAVAFIGALAVVSPGPDFLIVMTNSLRSKRAGLATVLGIVLGNVWWIACTIGGLSYLIKETVILFNIVKMAGALYLIYIGAKAVLSRPAASGADEKEPEPMSAVAGFRTGFVTNLLNVKCMLFFGALFGMFISPETPAYARVLYGSEVTFIAALWFSIVALVLSNPRFKGKMKRWLRPVEKVAGSFLVFLGVKVALSSSK